jgi:predicted secreted acid phosphatase
MSKEWVRSDWIKNSDFHSVDQAAVLDQIKTKVLNEVQNGKTPVVVFDLDSTLFDVSHRSFQILTEWLKHPESHTYSETVEVLNRLQPTEMKYSLEDVWNGRKIPMDQDPYSGHLKMAKGFWRKRFFSNHYTQYDQPMPGAIDYVNQLHRLGAHITYLTGRDAPLMAFGTYDQLAHHGLPIEVDRTRLILKPKRHIDDLVFKTGVASLMMELGPVVASFENEPKNLVAMANVFNKSNPETLNVFIETVSSDHPAPEGQGLYRIQNFKL